MENVKIRPATAADVEALSEIVKVAWKPIFDGYRVQLGDAIYDVAYAEDPLEKKAREVQCSVENGLCFVAEYEGKVVGFATYFIDGKVGNLTSNAVILRGHGIAGLLHTRVFEEMKARGCEAVLVRTGLDDAHAPARRAYEKDGFQNAIPGITYYKKL